MFEEIQSVTYGQRLPKVSDRERLPYSEAVFRETIRKHPFLPIGQFIFVESRQLVVKLRPFIVLGIPHVNEQDEVIGGYMIPKGTMIQYNTG
jgi:cytochrome P450